MSTVKVSESDGWVSFHFNTGYELYFELEGTQVRASVVYKNSKELADLKVRTARAGTTTLHLNYNFDQTTFAKLWEEAIAIARESKGNISEKARTALLNSRSTSASKLLHAGRVRLSS